VKVNIKFTLEQATKPQMRRGLPLIFQPDDKWGWVVNAATWPLYPMETDPTPTVQNARWTPGLVWMDAGIFAPTAIRSLDHPAQSESLYYLRYRGPHYL